MNSTHPFYPILIPNSSYEKIFILFVATSSSRPVAGSHSPVASSSSPIACSYSRSPAVSSPAASIPRPAAIGSSGPAIRGGRNPTVRGRRSPTASSPCPAMSRDDEVVGVHSSNDGTSDEESVNDKAQELFMEEISKLMDTYVENIKSEF